MRRPRGGWSPPRRTERRKTESVVALAVVKHETSTGWQRPSGRATSTRTAGVVTCVPCTIDLELAQGHAHVIKQGERRRKPPSRTNRTITQRHRAAHHPSRSAAGQPVAIHDRPGRRTAIRAPHPAPLEKGCRFTAQPPHTELVLDLEHLSYRKALAARPTNPLSGATAGCCTCLHQAAFVFSQSFLGLVQGSKATTIAPL